MRQEKFSYLSNADEAALQILRVQIAEAKQCGDLKAAQRLAVEYTQIINRNVVTTLELFNDDIQDDELLMYSDLSVRLTNTSPEFFKQSTVHLELNLTKDSPLYKDVVALLHKHLNDPQEA